MKTYPGLPQGVSKRKINIVNEQHALILCLRGARRGWASSVCSWGRLLGSALPSWEALGTLRFCYQPLICENTLLCGAAALATEHLGSRKSLLALPVGLHGLEEPRVCLQLIHSWMTIDYLCV